MGLQLQRLSFQYECYLWCEDVLYSRDPPLFLLELIAGGLASQKSCSLFISLFYEWSNE